MYRNDHRCSQSAHLPRPSNAFICNIVEYCTSCKSLVCCLSVGGKDATWTPACRRSSSAAGWRRTSPLSANAEWSTGIASRAAFVDPPRSVSTCSNEPGQKREEKRKQQGRCKVEEGETEVRQAGLPGMRVRNLRMRQAKCQMSPSLDVLSTKYGNRIVALGLDKPHPSSE